MSQTRLSAVVCSLIVFIMIWPLATACDDTEIDESGLANLAPDVPPVTEGDWYRPGIDTSWQIQLSGETDSSYNVDLYDLDLFDTEVAAIAALKADGRAVICYFSAGSSEDWRPDFERFEAEDMGLPLDGWEGENWLDIRSANVWEIMLERLDLAVEKGCDGVDPDNMNGYDNENGLGFTAEDQLAFNRNLANEAHRRGLTVGLKNDLEQIPELVEYFDFELNEQCRQYDECELLQAFVESGKAAFNIEYADDEAAAESRAAEICPLANGENIRTLLMPLELDGSWRVACDAY